MPRPNSNQYTDIVGTGITLIATEKGAVFLIDTADQHIAKRHCWSLHEHGYAQAGIRVGGKQKKIYLHRLLCATTEEAPHVDHANGIEFDNRSANLRACTRNENLRNQKLRVDNALGLKGVHLHRKTGKYVARVNQKHIGLFATPEEASRAASAARDNSHGEFARHE